MLPISLPSASRNRLIDFSKKRGFFASPYQKLLQINNEGSILGQVLYAPFHSCDPVHELEALFAFH